MHALHESMYILHYLTVLTAPLPEFNRQRLPVQGEGPSRSGICACTRLHARQGLTLPLIASQLLLIGDSGVGKSCLLLRFAVRPPRAQTRLAHAERPHPVADRCAPAAYRMTPIQRATSAQSAWTL